MLRFTRRFIVVLAPGIH